MTKRLSQKSKAFCWTLGSWINHTLCISKKLVNFNTIFPGESIAASHGMIYIACVLAYRANWQHLATSEKMGTKSKMVDGPTCFEDHRLELIWNTAVHTGTVPAAKRHRGTVRAKQNETAKKDSLSQWSENWKNEEFLQPTFTWKPSHLTWLFEGTREEVASICFSKKVVRFRLYRCTWDSWPWWGPLQLIEQTYQIIQIYQYSVNCANQKGSACANKIVKTRYSIK